MEKILIMMRKRSILFIVIIAQPPIVRRGKKCERYSQIKKFLPDNYKRDAFHKFYNFLHTELSVEDYTTKFEYLILWCDVMKLEDQIIAHMGGFYSTIHDTSFNLGSATLLKLILQRLHHLRTLRNQMFKQLVLAVLPSY